MPSNDEINAAFDKVNARLHRLIEERVPYMFKGTVLGFLDSPNGRQHLVAGIREGLEAAERVRDREAANAKVKAPK
jgi:hypothetical protein